MSKYNEFKRRFQVLEELFSTLDAKIPNVNKDYKNMVNKLNSIPEVRKKRAKVVGVIASPVITSDAFKDIVKDKVSYITAGEDQFNNAVLFL